MAGPPPFAKEKREAVTAPADAGVSTSPHQNAAPPRQTASPPSRPRTADPAVTSPYKELKVRSRYECHDMEELARKSATFQREEKVLRKAGVSIDYQVGRLPRQAGGGRTIPLTSGNFEVKLDPETVKPGHHIFDVFLHEYGHVVEMHRMRVRKVPEKKYYLEFMNQVQRELGLRLTPDTHEEPKTPSQP